jgi:hypothetical protein
VRNKVGFVTHDPNKVGGAPGNNSDETFMDVIIENIFIASPTSVAQTIADVDLRCVGS